MKKNIIIAALIVLVVFLGFFAFHQKTRADQCAAEAIKQEEIAKEALRQIKAEEFHLEKHHR